MAAAPAGRILIVDDEVGLMTALQESLAQQGYETAGAQSAQDALRLLKEQEFDLLLCDLMMPGMDGITLLFEAQAQDPDLAGIIMTGQATIQTAVDAMKIGAYDYVLKPFKLSTLLPILERALQVRRLRMDNLRLRETLAIYELAQTVSSPFDLDALLRKIADAALQQCPAKQISILLPTRERNELYVALERGERLEHRVGCRIPMEQGLAGLASPAAAPATPQRAMDDTGEAQTESRGNGSALAFPLMAGGRLVGVLQVTVAAPSRALTAGQRTAMNILAGLAASILENARQFEEVRLAHEELQIRARRLAADIIDRKQAEEERERLLAELQVAHKRQILLSRQLLEAHESERRNVARDLHDDIGQMLIALKMNLQCADAASVPTEKRTTALSESLQLADRLIHEVRELALSLRPPLLDELGLAPALKAFAERQIQRAGLQLDFAADPLDPAPEANLATACFRVAQEAMSNAIRHARAGMLTVRLRLRDTNLELLVRDDGAGFDVPIARGEAGRGRSMGLLSMEERVRLLGGQIAITSAPGQGTEICASFPLHRPPQPLEESPSS